MVFNLIFYMIAMSSFYANKLNDKKVAIAGFVITLITYAGLVIYLKTGKTVKVDALLEEKKEEGIDGIDLTQALNAATEGAVEELTKEGIEQINILALKTAYLHPYLK